MRNLLGYGAACLFLIGAAPVPSGQAEVLEQLRQADMRIASIGYRLSVGAASLCDRREPGLGIQLHTLAQYAPETRAAVRAHFGFTGPIAIEGVVADSPATDAGLKQNDVVVAIGPVVLPADVPAAATTETLAKLHAEIATLAPASALSVEVERGGRRLQLQIVPVPACFSRYELRIADAFDARANGELIQITSKYLEETPDELLPAVLAHELAHNILRHRDRLTAADAEFGFASGFGRNVGLFRQTEIQADILSVHLLMRAGYDPRIAERFWREVGPKLLAGKVRSRSHPSLADRIATMKAVIARVIAAGGNADLPEFYRQRDRPLDGNWRSLLNDVR